MKNGKLHTIAVELGEITNDRKWLLRRFTHARTASPDDLKIYLFDLSQTPDEQVLTLLDEKDQQVLRGLRRYIEEYRHTPEADQVFYGSIYDGFLGFGLVDMPAKAVELEAVFAREGGTVLEIDLPHERHTNPEQARGPNSTREVSARERMR